jgi:hypothetical protein
MSYNIIYGKGSTPEEALLYSKINEIGHGTKPRFLKKTNIKYLEYTPTLETDLFMSSYQCDRELTISEKNANKRLIECYGEEELKTIMDIYSDIDSEYSICFKIDTSNVQNLYKFLY